MPPSERRVGIAAQLPAHRGLPVAGEARCRRCGRTCRARSAARRVHRRPARRTTRCGSATPTTRRASRPRSRWRRARRRRGARAARGRRRRSSRPPWPRRWRLPTLPSYSSTSTSWPPPPAAVWSWIGGTRFMSAHTVPHREWWCSAQPTPAPGLVQLEVQRDAERCGPVALDHVALEVDADDVVGAELLPGEEPRVAQQRAVALVHGDVAGEVVVVALVPERTGEQDDLLALGELGRETLGRRSEGRAVGRSSVAASQ